MRHWQAERDLRGRTHLTPPGFAPGSRPNIDKGKQITCNNGNGSAPSLTVHAVRRNPRFTLSRVSRVHPVVSSLPERRIDSRNFPCDPSIVKHSSHFIALLHDFHFMFLSVSLSAFT